jgi:dTDP-glucose 4,6-dehydratase
MTSLLVTGGCGFIGANFIRLLLKEGGLLAESPYDFLLNLDALSYAGNPANLKEFEKDGRYLFVKGSIGDRYLVNKLLVEHGVSAIVNFAAESHVDRSIEGPEVFIETNVLETQRLLEASRQYWLNLSDKRKLIFRFLHVSTDEVFGSLGTNDPAFCESTPYAPNSPYSASKASSDFLVRAYYHTYGFPVMTTNCSNNYGPYQFPEKLIPLMLLNALEGKSLPVYGDGKNVRDWLYVEDHCEAIMRVLAGGVLGETYCVGGRNEIQNIEIVKTLCKILDEERPCSENANFYGKDLSNYSDLITYVQDRPGHDQRYAIDCSKIESELGWLPSETFESGILKTVNWYLENSVWCDEIAKREYNRSRLGMA